MLPKDMLLSRSIRKEVWQNHPDSFQKKKKLFGLINTAGISTTIIVIAYVASNSVNHKKDPYLLGCISHFLKVCPTFVAPLIKRVLDNFVTDEFCPDPIPDIVLEALESEVGDFLKSSAVFCLCSCCCQFGFILEIILYDFTSSQSCNRKIKHFCEICIGCSLYNILEEFTHSWSIYSGMVSSQLAKTKLTFNWFWFEGSLN